eukprot:TRINITY_DN11515_c0_g1_i2.p1 TRINITY_DN11515_c0_g1~~TRINITY_DN11515_c0_g1_i2.p1  ORF type:complete len:638 (+),score=153.40 TRINITY_DN11515_c0_g1_i2:108-2021(+)
MAPPLPRRAASGLALPPALDRLTTGLEPDELQAYRENYQAFRAGQADGVGTAAAPGAAAACAAPDQETTPIWTAKLGPPLKFLPDTISPEELQAYREKYQAFRAGEARGAKGEVNYLGRFALAVPRRVRARCHGPSKSVEQDYVVSQKVLGKGFEGQVFLVTSKGNARRRFAMKRLKLQGVSQERRRSLENEVHIFLLMDHRHVARLIDVYECNLGLSLIMECLEGGTLRDEIDSWGIYPETKARGVSKQMLLSISYIHSKGIAHRDIKPENFMYEARKKHLKLIDFGFSKLESDFHERKKAGTLQYSAPEALDGTICLESDIWGVGVIIFELVNGERPFHGAKEKLIGKIRAGKYAFNKVVAARTSKEVKPFVDRFLQVDPAARVAARAALLDPWFPRATSPSLEAAVDSDMLDALVAFEQMAPWCRQSLNMVAWSVSDEELKGCRESFLAIDHDHDGVITLGDLRRVLERFGVDEEGARHIFEALDVHRNGVVHYSEFLAAMAPRSCGLRAELMACAFRKMDTDNTGVITAANLRELMGHRQDLPQHLDEAGGMEYEEFARRVGRSAAPSGRHALGHANPVVRAANVLWTAARSDGAASCGGVELVRRAMEVLTCRAKQGASPPIPRTRSRSNPG